MRKFIVIIFLFVSNFLQAQDHSQGFKKEFDIGFGLGIDYGGIGIRGTILPTQHLGLFAAVGYNLNSIGFNAGGQWHFPKNRHDFFLTGMYGYNAVIVMSGDINDKATYYGFSTGAGYQLKMKNNYNFWNFELLYPLRNSNYEKDLDVLETIGADLKKPLPVAFSIGLHFKIPY